VRIVLEPDWPTVDTGELTAKQSISAATLVRRRAGVVDELYATPASPRVIAAKPLSR
jgi:feruloyl-CoA synthase